MTHKKLFAVPLLVLAVLALFAAAYADDSDKDRLGPYPTRQEAERALETVRRRNEEWDAQDR